MGDKVVNAPTGDVWETYTDRVSVSEEIEAGGIVEVLDVVVVEEASVHTAGTRLLHLLSDSLQFGTGGIKTVGWVQLDWDMDSSNPISIYLKTRFSTQDSWVTSSEIEVNQEGAAYFGLSGVEFQIGVKADEVTNMQPNGKILVGVQTPDKRTVRGAYAN